MWLYTPATASSLIFDNIKVEADPTLSPTYLDGIIDQFGQYTEKDWPTKIHTPADLVASKNAELQKLDADRITAYNVCYTKLLRST